MASSYPGALDSFSNPTPTTLRDAAGGLAHDVQHANANDAIEAIQTTLGVDPQGTFTDVAERLDSIPDPSAAADGDVLTVDTGAWVIAPGGGGGGGGGGGLVLIDSGTVSASSGFSLTTGVFDSTYDDYLLKLSLALSTDLTVRCRLRASGTDDSGANYYTQRFGAYSGASFAAANPDGDTWQHINYGMSAARMTMELRIIDPANTLQTTFHGTGMGGFSGAPVAQSTIGHAFTTTAYDALTIATSTGTMTGRWALYGYAK